MSLHNVLVSLSVASLAAAAGVPPQIGPEVGAKPIPFMQEEKPQINYDVPSTETIFVPFGVDLLEEKKMPLYINEYDPSSADRRQGVRIFATPVAPGQTLTLTIKATPMSSYLLNWVLPSERSHPLYLKLKMGNDNQETRRTPTISIKNTTKEPCQVTFSIMGIADESYSVKIKRK